MQFKMKILQPGTAFRRATSDVRRRHPLPYLQETALPEAQIRYLKRQLDDAMASKMTAQSIRPYARRLSRNQRIGLMTCFEHTDNPEMRRLIAALICDRPSWLLATHAWQTAQRLFPDPLMFNVLHWMIGRLNPDHGKLPAAISRELVNLIAISPRPEDCLANLNDQLNKRIAVAEAADPEGATPKSNHVLDEFMERYRLNPKSELVTAVLGEFFWTCQPQWLEINQKLLFSVIHRLNPVRGGMLVGRIIQARGLPTQVRQVLLNRVASNFPVSGERHPIWRSVRPDLAQNFLRQYYSGIISRQCAVVLEKRDLLLGLVDNILDAMAITPEVMALRFDGFILLDNINYPERILYYTYPSARSLLMRGYDELDLANPPFPVSTLSELRRNSQPTEIVKLLFTPEELASTTRFLRQSLGHPGDTGRPTVQGWLKV